MIVSETIFTRIKVLKKYIAAVDEKVKAHDYHQAAAVVKHFKQADKKRVIECKPSIHKIQTLEENIEKLKANIAKLTQEKLKLQQQISQSKRGYAAGVKAIQASIFISRFQITLQDIKQIEYQPVIISSDFHTITVNSVANQCSPQKYNNYLISIEAIISHEKKQQYILLNGVNIQKQQFYCMLKFLQEKDAIKWANSIYYAKLLAECKHRDKLFLPDSRSVRSKEANKSTSSKSKVLIVVPNSPVEVKQISNDQYSSLQHSLNQSHINSVSQANKSEVPVPATRKLETNRPGPLTRLRGRSQNTKQKSIDVIRNYKTRTNYRKGSQDIFRPKLNTIYHQRMLERNKLRDSENSQSNQSKSKLKRLMSLDVSSNMSNKIAGLINKKKDILGTHAEQDAKAHFPMFQESLNWIGIEQLDDQSKSKSSKHNNSKINEPVLTMSKIQRQPQEIKERSEEDSPMIKKMNYQDGTVFILHPVPSSTKKETLQEDKTKDEEQEVSLEDSQDSHQEPSSHANTESQQNNQRIVQLKKGIILTKCAENGLWPREKVLYLSGNQEELCSRDVKDKKVKKISIQNIESVCYGKYEKGIKKHMENVQPSKCLLIKALTQDKRIKNYQFVGNVAKIVQNFANELKLLLQYRKKQ